jgi:hypothetical protein
MLNCRVCLWRCIDALDTSVSVSASKSLLLRRNVTSAFAQGQQQRSIRTAPSRRDSNSFDRPGREDKTNAPLHNGVRSLAHTEDEPWKKSTQAASLGRRVRDGRTRQPRFGGDSTAETRNGGYVKIPSGGKFKKYGSDTTDGPASTPYGSREAVEVTPERKLGRRDPRMSSIDWNRRRKEMQYLSDPLELATFVKKELMKDKATEMLQLVQMASHSMQAVVSWNHLIDYHLAKGKVSQAFKIYNDVGFYMSTRGLC